MKDGSTPLSIAISDNDMIYWLALPDKGIYAAKIVDNNYGNPSINFESRFKNDVYTRTLTFIQEVSPNLVFGVESFEDGDGEGTVYHLTSMSQHMRDFTMILDSNQRYYQARVPKDFDIEDFPFIFVREQEQISLLVVGQNNQIRVRMLLLQLHDSEIEKHFNP